MNDKIQAAGDEQPVDENQIIAERRGKLAKLREKGQPFPNSFKPEHRAADLHAKYGLLDKEPLDPQGMEVSVSGRMMLKRVMGKASFATVQDGTGRIQFYINYPDLKIVYNIYP